MVDVCSKLSKECTASIFMVTVWIAWMLKCWEESVFDYVEELEEIRSIRTMEGWNVASNKPVVVSSKNGR